MTATLPVQLVLLHLNVLTIFGELYKLRSFSSCKFVYSTLVYSLLLHLVCRNNENYSFHSTTVSDRDFHFVSMQQTATLQINKQTNKQTNNTVFRLNVRDK